MSSRDEDLLPGSPAERPFRLLPALQIVCVKRWTEGFVVWTASSNNIKSYDEY